MNLVLFAALVVVGAFIVQESCRHAYYKGREDALEGVYDCVLGLETIDDIQNSAEMRRDYREYEMIVEKFRRYRANLHQPQTK